MKRMLLLCTVLLCSSLVRAQLLTWTPSFPKEDDASQTLVITVDASKGNSGLLNQSPGDVYVHTGVITTTSNGGWAHVPFTWGSTTAAAKAVSLGNNKWSFTILGSLRSFYGLTDANEKILKLAILFRSGDGNKAQRNADGSDMYLPVYSSDLAVRITDPLRQPTFTPTPEPVVRTVGNTINITAVSSAPATLKIYMNGTVIQTANTATTISATPTLTTSGNQEIVAEAANGPVVVKDTFRVFVSSVVNVAALPADVREGINYEAGNTAATLVLKAPLKSSVSVIGEFPGSNWTQQTQYLMNKTPDGKYWWLRITGLTPGTEYAYQYLVDGSLKIADPYSEKILDPYNNNDQNISASTYPNLRTYPAGQSGIVSVLQTAEPSYTWSSSAYTRPDKRGLVIYELLVRDFVAAHDWKTIRDSLNYLKKLGINAIEIMPFNEFEGNNSWGYNPDFYFAPDKYYGPKNTLKEFIDSCHKKGIAVIMDIALNHSFGLSPMVQLYFNSATNRPTADNPWFNPVAKHDFNVGFDMNHESLDARYFVSRVVEHWLQQYKIDGFRFDLSKGFTQTQTCDANGLNCNVGAWGNVDAGRIAIWKRYYDTMQLKSPGSIAILEHFADNQEEMQLSDYGMLLWGNMNYNFTQAAMGNYGQGDFSGAIHSVRTWSKPHLVGYMESHDEERIVRNSIVAGFSGSNGYNVRDTATALKRMQMNASFLFTIPGPKMIWQFGELGYPYSINTCTDLSVNDSCRVTRKPVRWDYLQDTRRQAVYATYSKLLALRSHPWYKELFLSGSVIDRSLGTAVKTMRVSSGDSSQIYVIGNFDVNPQTGNVFLPTAGNWFDYLNDVVFNSTGSNQSITLQPGEFRVFVNRNVNNLIVTPVANVPWNGSSFEASLYPNPAKGNLTVKVSLPQSSAVTVRLYSLTGQDMGTLYNGFLSQGEHKLNLNREGMATGSYYLRVSTKTATTTLQVVYQ